MTVYLAYQGFDYDGDSIIGVFDNLDAAIACCRETYNHTWTHGQTWREEFGSLGASFSAHTKGSYVRVYPYEVRSTFGG